MKERTLKIVSGGQTGADRGGLDAAIECEVPHGGWCPRGRLAEDGPIPSCYCMRETEGRKYIERTRANVRDSDGTVIFTYGEPEGGSKATLIFAEELCKPYVHIDIGAYGDLEAAEILNEWVWAEERSSFVLNVAGSRESTTPGIEARVYNIIRQFIALSGIENETE